MGVVHGELTSLLWGGAFAFVWAYAVVARTVAGRHPLARKPEGSLETVGPGVLVFRTAHCPPAPAFFTWSVVVKGDHSAARKFDRRERLEAGDTALEGELLRGRYRVEARWELTDAFGFTRLVPAHRWRTVVTVAPTPVPFVPPPPPATGSGPWRPRRTGRRAGDPFDVRPYIPGDDLRRLHWPLYAHSDTLFVRTADPVPPPSGHEFLVLDTEAPTEEDLDLRLGALMTWLADLSARSVTWTLAIPSIDRVVTGSEDPAPLLSALTTTPLPDGPVPVTWPGALTLVTGPASRGAVALAGRLTASRRRFHPVEIALAPRSPTLRRRWWSRK